ncbi:MULTISPECIES: bifunctional [glutamine synthetase] adenylyltransferase/[glutamine synthetase]-adenylyl-L-tyrosine phosphorylase [Inquilinus]|uniref:Bifunctional glutamine synthetase adenylyltransferase/adenylyl-removing enzyme n=1 Tax=Inquilinus ginsengisoli TaxID=363840 RepID=A0ABU1JU75_9PROT|nr:bifunctional [glutamine synthetase] adenylyltransferase/[glutamine synthetase]-adenylyl-L-tyrosine phosphorylase [Inquilinus ginsengisoli]MDR6291124.1 glutamate-ammonia-ligase adenylyltransferase [Inquilinus ginsengisoli]
MPRLDVAWPDAVWPRAGDPDRARRGLERWVERAAEQSDPELREFAVALPSDPGGHALLEAVFGGSPYLTELVLKTPATIRRFLAEGPDAAVAAELATLRAELAAETDTARLMAAFRLAKRRTALLIALADIGSQWPLERVTAALSDLADTTLDLAISHLLARAVGRGLLRPEAVATPDASGLIVLGMGKLGARELNYSSDIDLIIFYDRDKVPTDRPDDLGQTFTRLVREMVRIMEERTVDGYVFRTDLRLRPDPGATPPAVSLEAAETYYTSLAQSWERAAMIKARPVAGDKTAGDAFLDFLTPFVWRRNLDFAAIQDIHAIKRQIHSHHGHGVVAIEGHDLKLGRGGIREIEFFVQMQQLIFGGREPKLRLRGTIAGLTALAEAGRVDRATAASLAECYRFLRRVEHRIQMVDDRQTHALSENPAEVDALARFLGFPDPAGFRTVLTDTLRLVEGRYAELFQEERPPEGSVALVFAGADDHPGTVETLQRLGFARPPEAIAIVRGWLHGRYRALRSDRARTLINSLLPRLLAIVGATADADATLQRLDGFLGRLPAGVQLFSLFNINPELLDLLIDILGFGGRIADYLTTHAGQLEAVLAPGFFTTLPEQDRLEERLGSELATARDFEDSLDVLRRWTNDQRFRAAVHILRRLSETPSCAAFLSDVTEVALRALTPRVEAEFARRHGRFPDGGIALLALGKLGGREMTIRSDLDLIMIHDAGADQVSDGDKPIGPMVYYTRLIQRLVSAITAPTAQGALFEVDMRLRPSGNSGPLATSLDAFTAYQQGEAWTWEHMALTRARVILAPEPLRRRIEAEVRAVLCMKRDPDTLRRDIAEMRGRMARQRDTADIWNIKHFRGGLVDIEFIAQHLQLLHAAEHPDILHQATAEALRRIAAAGLLPPDEAEVLQRALATWQRLQAFLRFAVEDKFDPADASHAMIQGLLRAIGENRTAPPEDLDAAVAGMQEQAAAVMAIFDRVIGPPPPPRDEPAKA